MKVGDKVILKKSSDYYYQMKTHWTREYGIIINKRHAPLNIRVDIGRSVFHYHDERDLKLYKPTIWV